MSAEVHSDGSVTLRIEREFAYPPQKVFEAWLDPQQLMIWMGPSDEVRITNVTVNAVEGGDYHMDFNDPDGTVNRLNGRYQKIQRHTELVFTWIWEPPTEGANHETLVSLDFQPIPQGTKLTLMHQRFSSTELRDRHAAGWAGCLDKLARRTEQLFEIR